MNISFDAVYYEPSVLSYPLGQQLKEKYADYKVILTQEIDDTLLGGYVLRIGNHEYDKSYKERLRQLQEKITGR